MARSKDFQLGDQPEWANTEAAVAKEGVAYVAQLIDESPARSLLTRGFAVVELAQATREKYDVFHIGFENFCALPREERAKHALLQFDKAAHSPNQYHGYSEVANLKTQFMMRLQGHGGSLLMPQELQGAGPPLFQDMDALCRDLEGKVLAAKGMDKRVLSHILDPTPKSPVEAICVSDGNVVCSSYLPDGFVSSSIMDNFHYCGEAASPLEENKDQEHAERFVNNHSSHTDSGLMTAVVTTDVPGLEVLDQSCNEWIAIEQHMHEFAKAQGVDHRSFAVFFWGDSVVHLGVEGATPSLHRVQRTDKERFSVVFKQRTSPLTTPPRYQEDYDLIGIQNRALAPMKEAAARRRLHLLLAGSMLAVASLLPGRTR